MNSAIAGDEEELVAQRLGQQRRDGDRLALRAPDEARAVLDDEGEAEGQQQAVERIAPVQRADQHALDGKADERGKRAARSAARPRSRHRA